MIVEILQRKIMKYINVFTSCLVGLLLMMGISTAFSAENSQELNYGMGILNIRSQSVAQSFRLTLPFFVPGDIKQGWQTFAHANWTNVWAQEKGYVLDYEMLDSSLGFSYGFNQRLGMGILVDSRSCFGGEMDGFIQGFHDFFNIDQNNRDEYSKGMAVISAYNPETGELISQHSARELNNSGLNFFMNYNFIHSNRVLPALNIYCVARYALESPDIITRGNGLDLGLGIGLAKRWSSNFYTYGIAGYTLFDDDQGALQKDVLKLKDQLFTGLFVMGYRMSQNITILAQYLYSTSVVEDLTGLDEPSHEVQFGLKLRLGEKTMMNFSIIENIINMDNGPDFGIHLGWSLEL